MATQAKRDYYEILGVDRSATDAEINNAFAKLQEEFHAAGKPTSIDDIEQIRLLRRAYEVLTDSGQRRSYDRTGDEGGPEPMHGYDFAAIERISRKVDSDIKAARIRWLVHGILRFLRLR